jgi:hypothetical protein
LDEKGTRQKIILCNTTYFSAAELTEKKELDAKKSQDQKSKGKYLHNENNIFAHLDDGAKLKQEKLIDSTKSMFLIFKSSCNSTL